MPQAVGEWTPEGGLIQTPDSDGLMPSKFDPFILKKGDDVIMTNEFALSTDGIIRGPWGFPPEFFIQQGQDAKAAADSLSLNPWTRFWFHMNDLRKFGQGGPWDLQRLETGKVDDKYVDYATVAIGLYAGAAEMPRFETLSISNTYAYYKSKFGKVPMSEEFGYLPKQNVLNTDLGYELEKLIQLRR